MSTSNLILAFSLLMLILALLAELVLLYLLKAVALRAWRNVSARLHRNPPGASTVEDASAGPRSVSVAQELGAAEPTSEPGVPAGDDPEAIAALPATVMAGRPGQLRGVKRARRNVSLIERLRRMRAAQRHDRQEQPCAVPRAGASDLVADRPQGSAHASQVHPRVDTAAVAVLPVEAADAICAAVSA